MSYPFLQAPCRAHGQAHVYKSHSCSSREASLIMGRTSRVARLCGDVSILGPRDLGSPCVMAGLGDAGFVLRHCPCPCMFLVEPQALCRAPHLLCWWLSGDVGETVDDLSLKSLISKYHVCCGLLSQQHCEQMRQGLLFSLF